MFIRIKGYQKLADVTLCMRFILSFLLVFFPLQQTAMMTVWKLSELFCAVLYTTVVHSDTRAHT